MNIEVVQISSPSELPKATCREYAGVPASEAVTAFQRTGQTPGEIYQYGKRLFVFAIEAYPDRESQPEYTVNKIYAG